MAKKIKPIKLTEDHVFKHFLYHNRQVLSSLLKCFLPIDKDTSDFEIRSVNMEKAIDDTSQQGQKKVVLDLHVKLRSGENINIEMQTSPQQGFLSRMLLYWVKLHGDSVKEGEEYKNVRPTYSLIFTTFSVFKDKPDEYYHEFVINKKNDPDFLYNDDLHLIYVEMNKMRKKCSELVDLMEFWCYLFMRAHKLTAEERAHLTKMEVIKMSLEIYRKMKQKDSSHLTDLGAKLVEMDYLAMVDAAKEKIKAEGKTEGKAEVAVEMLQEGYTISSISKMTGLSKTKISRLKNGK